MLEAELGIGSFWPSKMGHEHHGSTLLQNMLNGWQCCPNARVVCHFARFIQRHIEIYADQRSLAFKVKIGQVHELELNSCARPTFS